MAGARLLLAPRRRRLSLLLGVCWVHHVRQVVTAARPRRAHVGQQRPVHVLQVAQVKRSRQEVHQLANRFRKILDLYLVQ